MALNILKDKEIKEAKAKEKLYFFNDNFIDKAWLNLRI